MQRLLLILFLPLCAASAQQQVPPSPQDGPMNIPTQPQASPKPDAEGVYRIGPGIAAPTLNHPESAAYPEGSLESDLPHISLLAVVVGVDGSATSIRSVFRNDSVYDAGAISAVQQSRFEPGTFEGKPVPVLVHVRVPFFHLQPAIPAIQQSYAWHAEGSLQSENRVPAQAQDGTIPPRATHTVEAEFSEKARRARVGGTVLISLVVSADGLPTDLKVERSPGWGLDEKALQAVRQYRFQPAVRDGKPVPQKISVEVNFRIYK